MKTSLITAVAFAAATALPAYAQSTTIDCSLAENVGSAACQPFLEDLSASAGGGLSADELGPLLLIGGVAVFAGVLGGGGGGGEGGGELPDTPDTPGTPTTN